MPLDHLTVDGLYIILLKDFNLLHICGSPRGDKSAAKMV